jgi:hypothetical protein
MASSADNELEDFEKSISRLLIAGEYADAAARILNFAAQMAENAQEAADEETKKR